MSRYINMEEALSFPFANGQYDHKNADENFILGCESYKEWLENLPTADVIPVKHGHWIGKPLAGYSTVKCSACGSAFVENNGKWKYCPHCGAKMDEPTQSNDSNALDALGEKVKE